MTSDINRDYTAPIIPQDDGTLRISGWNTSGDCDILPGDLVGKTAFTATGGTVARSAADRAGDFPQPAECGALSGDGVTNDTATLQAALDKSVDGVCIVRLVPGTYLVDNLIINTGVKTIIYGNGATIKKRNGGDNTYCVASANWVNNDAYANDPCEIYGLKIDGNSLCSSGGLILQSWNSLISNCEAHDCAGEGIMITANTKDGTELSSTLVNNRINSCRSYSNGANGIRVKDTQRNKATDAQVRNCYLYDNAGRGAAFDGFVGSRFSGNHTYSNTLGGCVVGLVGVGAICADNYFEESEGLRITDMLVPAYVQGCRFLGKLIGEFSASADAHTIYSIGNRFEQASARIRHEYWDGNKTIYSIGDTFVDAQPFEWHNGSSPAPIIAQMCRSAAALNYLFDGLQQTITSTFTPSVKAFASAAPAAGTWPDGAIVWNTAPAAGAAIGWVRVSGAWKTFGAIAP